MDATSDPLYAAEQPRGPYARRSARRWGETSMYARRGFLLAAVLIAGVGAAQAQEKYPTRPIKLVVAVIAGGPMDVMGRLVAQQLSASLGPVFVENRAGAGTTLGAKAVASAEPDGYTLLLGNAATLAIGPALYKSAGYDPLTSFAPVAFIASVPYVMIVSPAVPARTVGELVAYAKAQPPTQPRRTCWRRGSRR
jgi:tripartite-type tricarboxylate transporter receptor subunit TctC